jgi:hypothetical protein
MSRLTASRRGKFVDFIFKAQKVCDSDNVFEYSLQSREYWTQSGNSGTNHVQFPVLINPVELAS